MLLEVSERTVGAILFGKVASRGSVSTAGITFGDVGYLDAAFGGLSRMELGTFGVIQILLISRI